jgi:hypothetical protein
MWKNTAPSSTPALKLSKSARALCDIALKSGKKPPSREMNITVGRYNPNVAME